VPESSELPIFFMPFQSEKQRRFLWKFHPKIAEAWAHGRSSVTGKKEGRHRKALHEMRRKNYQ